MNELPPQPRSIAQNTVAEPITLTTRPTLSELIHMAAALSRGGWFANGFAGYTGAAALIGIVMGAPLVIVLPAGLLALLLMTGYFSAPFIWFMAMRRRDLALAPTTITLDETGVTYETATARGRHDWSVYRRSRDLGNTVLLEAGPAMGAAIPKSAIADPAALTNLLAAHGLVREPTSLERARPLLALALGVAVYLAQLAIQGSIS